MALTKTDQEIRDKLANNLDDLGLNIRIDEIGNMFGRREGTEPDSVPVFIGLHLDSQPYSEHYDGQLDLLSALETLRVFEEEKIENAVL